MQRMCQLWITQSVMFTRQTFLKHKYMDNGTDIGFFIVCKFRDIFFWVLILLYAKRPKLPLGHTFHSAKLWITQPVMLKHWYTDNVMDIVSFIVCKIYLLLVSLRVFLVVLGNWSCFIRESSEILRKIKYLLKSAKKSIWELEAFMSLLGRKRKPFWK